MNDLIEIKEINQDIILMLLQEGWSLGEIKLISQGLAEKLYWKIKDKEKEVENEFNRSKS